MNIFCIFLLFVCFAASISAYKVQLHTMNVTMADGILLHADVSVPVPEKQGEKFPVIIWANSWGLPQVEYLLKCLQWAEAGYIMFEYETRGWYASGGEIAMAGPLDQQDSITILDFVLSNTDWNIDSSNIAFGGISYGGGLAALAAANDNRVKTAIMMSGWSSIPDAFYLQQTASLVWSDFLVVLARVVGHVPAEMNEMFYDLFHHKDIDKVMDWAKLRSPITVIDRINARKVPMFISNNLEDELFKPNMQLALWEAVQGPKYMLLNQGIHATAELGGLVNIPNNFVFKQARKWVDYWLKGIQNDIMSKPPVTIELRNDFKQRVEFEGWPSKNVIDTRFNLGARHSKIYGTFLQSTNTKDLTSNATAKDIIKFSTSTGLHTGFPIMGDLLQVFIDVPILSDLTLAPRAHSVVYMSEHLGKATRLCGIPSVRIPVIANSEVFQVVAFLFNVDLLGVGTLLTHGPISCWNCTVGQTAYLAFEMRTFCFEAAKGHRLAVGVSLYSNLYVTANNDAKLSVEIVYDDPRGIWVSLPINK